MKRTSSFLRVVKKISIIFFTSVGIIFAGVFLGMHFGLFNVRGSIDDRNKFFANVDQSAILNAQSADVQRNIVVCESKSIGKYDQTLADNILLVWDKKGDVNLTSGMINNAITQINNNNPEIKNAINNCSSVSNLASVTSPSVFPWENTEDWSVVSSGLMKDSSIINKISQETGVPTRMIISAVIPEQFRFFSSNRESYKKYFEPLKILGTLTQFSLGVSGLKPDTATQIEKNNVDPTSTFYLGPAYEHTLDYPAGVNHETELYNRLTDSKDHYFQYLYTAFYIKQIEAQWLNAGYDLSYRPDVLGTLFNLGFYRSKPSDHPEVGGAVITAGTESISFGELSSEFYFSGALSQEFPY